MTTDQQEYNQTAWGNSYYSESQSSYSDKVKKPAPPSDVERRVAELLRKFAPDARERVERSFKQWNLALRDYLRNETGLRLTVGGDVQAVPVRIADGLPRPFAAVMEGFIDQAWLLVNRRLIDQTAMGLQLVENNFHKLTAWEALKPISTSQQEIRRVGEFIDRLKIASAEINFIKQIAAIQVDILGAYFFNVPAIDLYWMPIGILAAVLDVSVEGLTVAVAAHELAHAYTHLGRDIDGEKWAVKDFSSTDCGIIEGLAQFYTVQVCDRLKDRMPAALSGFQALLGVQSGPYTVFADWIETSSRPGEVVRVSMIECRSQGVKAHNAFFELIQKHAKDIVKTEKPVRQMKAW